MKNFTLFIITVFFLNVSHAQTVQLVTDINTTSDEIINPTSIFAASDRLYLEMFTSSLGAELYHSDGTTQGTFLIKDVCTGSLPSYAGEFSEVNGTIYFSAQIPYQGNELWKSDGSANGTSLVKDLYEGSGSGSPSKVIELNGSGYFFVNDGLVGFELYKTDGTASGTYLVKDIYPGSLGSASSISNLINVNGTLYFSANDGIHGPESLEK